MSPALTRTVEEVCEQFWSRVREDESGCWLWTGARTHGYGTLTIGGRRIYAHRFAYEHMRAEIPDGLVIDHLCRNSGCVNPWHLEPVTLRVNTARGMRATVATQQASLRTHCGKGHPYVGANFYHNGIQRVCRLCKQESKIRRRAAA